MEQCQRTKRFGVCVILCALAVRLTAEGVLLQLFLRLLPPAPAPIQIHTETGQDVRFSSSSDRFLMHTRESPPPWLPEPEIPRFSGGDGDVFRYTNTSSREPDLPALLETPLDWDLTGDQPGVLILHTHATESYTPGEEPYTPTASYRTLEEAQNMLSIGTAVARILERSGIGVIHDRTVYDHPSYNGAYVRARAAILAHLEENPSIRLVLDLHRDASGAAGAQLRTEAVVDGQPAAQLMLVVGTNYDTWQENLSLASKLHVCLEQADPGIMRPLDLRGQRFNQDLCPGALLVEVGAAGNTRQEALRSARKLAEAVIYLSRGANRELRLLAG